MHLGITFPWEKTTDSTILGGQAHFLQLDMGELESEEDSDGHEGLAQRTSATSLPSNASVAPTESAIPVHGTRPSLGEPWKVTETPFDLYEDALLQEHRHAQSAQAETGVSAASEPEAESTLVAPEPQPRPMDRDPIQPMSEAVVEDNPNGSVHDSIFRNPHEEATLPASPTSANEPVSSSSWIPMMHDEHLAPEATTLQMLPGETPTAPQEFQGDSQDPGADALGISSMPQQIPHTSEEFPYSMPGPHDTTEEPVRRGGRMRPTRRAVPDTSKLEERHEPPVGKTLKSKASRFFKKVFPKQQRSTADAPPLPTNRVSRASRLPFRSHKSEQSVQQASDFDTASTQPGLTGPHSLTGIAPSVTMQSTPPMVPNMLDRQEPSPYYSPEASLPSSPQAASHRLSFSSFRRQDATGASRPTSLFSLFKKRHQEPMSLSHQASNGRLPHCSVVEEPLPVAIEAQRQESLNRSHSRRRSLGGWDERTMQPSTQPRPPSVVLETSEPEAPSMDVPEASELPTEQSTVLSHGYETALEAHEPLVPETNTTPMVSDDRLPQEEPMPANKEDEHIIDEAVVVESKQHSGMTPNAELPRRQCPDSLSSDEKRLSLGLDENAWELELNFGALGESEASRNPYLASRAKEEPNFYDWFGERPEQAPVLPMLSQSEPIELAH